MRIALAITLALLPALASAQIPVLRVSPTTLLFVTAAGHSQPAPQQVRVENRGSGTLRWRVTADAEWIHVSPTSGMGDADLVVTIDPSRLRADKLDGHIRIDAVDADDSPATITVTAQTATTTRATSPPVAAAAKVPLTAAAGSKAPALWAFDLDGPGGAATNWQLSSDAPWLTAEPRSGRTSTRVNVKADASQLEPGGYQGSLQFFNTAGEPLLVVPVFFTVTATTGSAGAAGTAATTSGAAKPGQPEQPVPLTIDAQSLPPATRNLPYTQAVPVRGGKPPYTMRVVQGRLPVGLVVSNGAVIGMTHFAGNFQFTIAVTDSATPPALATQAMTLRVVILQNDTALAVDPPAISLVVAGAQRTQQARIGVGSGRQQLDWKASSDAAWLKVLAAEGVTPGAVPLEANATGLAPGTYVATVTIVMPGAPNSPASVPVQLTVRK
jgi:hypothetical protein